MAAICIKKVSITFLTVNKRSICNSTIRRKREDEDRILII